MAVLAQSIVTSPVTAAVAALWGIKTLRRRPIDISISGTHSIIPASPDLQHHIVKLMLITGGSTTLRLLDGNNAITGPMPFTANQGLAFDGDLSPIILTKGNAFNISSSASVQISGFVIYFYD